LAAAMESKHEPVMIEVKQISRQNDEAYIPKGFKLDRDD
jgi:hypothetical protein